MSAELDLEPTAEEGQRAVASVPAPAASILPPTAIDNERRLVDQAEHRLAREFPDVPRHQVSTVVACIWAEFDNAAVRDFVPVLVSKQAREELRDHVGTEGGFGPDT